MTLTPEQRLAETEKTLRRDQRLHIWLPFAVGAILLIVLVAFAALLPRVSVVANCLLTVLILCPALLCLLPIYFLTVFAVFGMNSLYNGAAKPLRSLEKLSARVLNRTTDVSDTLARSSINFNARLAPLSNWMEHAFDERKDDHEQPDSQQ
jgi:hypothetical protein